MEAIRERRFAWGSIRLAAQGFITGMRLPAAGEKIQTVLTYAPGNGAPIGGLKVVAENGWFAARPPGTEDIYKIDAETFRGADRLRRIPGGSSGDRQ